MSFYSYDSVSIIDCQYISPGRAGAYLIVEGEEAAFVDNNTSRAVPLLMEALEAAGLEPGQVRYAIVTHVHLDHSAGTSALLERCPNATVLAHPKAARHLCNPERLVRASKQVYGIELFDRLYGEILPIDPERVRAVEDGEAVRWDGRQLRFMHTLGHCSHHVCIHDSKTNGVFAGDNFGICYPPLIQGPRPFVFAAATPTEFDPQTSRESVERILATECERLYLSHFGIFENTPAFADEMRRSLDVCEALIEEAAKSGAKDEALRAFVGERLRQATEEAMRSCGIEINGESLRWVNPDIYMNTAGLVAAVSRRQRTQRRDGAGQAGM